MATDQFARFAALPADMLEVLNYSGDTAGVVANTLQGNGHFSDVAAKSLEQMINRYWKHQKAQQPAPPSPPPKDEPLPEVFSPLAELTMLARIQKSRVEKAMLKEKEMPVPLDSTNKVIAEYQATLAVLQKAQIEADAAKQKAKPETVGRTDLRSRVENAITMTEEVMNKGFS